MNDFLKQYNDDLLLINDYFENQLLDFDNRYEKKLFEAMRYTLLSEGKRIRAIIILEMGKLFNVDINSLLPYILTIESIHAYSLIHDDLPALDDDDYRRNQLSNHKKYGEAMAILAGDALLNFSFENMLKETLKNNQVKLALEISELVGTKGMISGQVGDLSEKSDISDFNYIYKNKTSNMFIASFIIAGYLSNQSEENLEKLRRIGLDFGFIFQLKDDLLDIDKNEDSILNYISKEDINNSIFNKQKLIKKELKDLFISEDISFMINLVDYIYLREK